MKCKRLLITPDLFLSLFHAGPHPHAEYTVTENAVPSDARLIDVRHGWGNFIEVLIESASFPEVPDGEIIPEMTPAIVATKGAPFTV